MLNWSEEGVIGDKVKGLDVIVIDGFGGFRFELVKIFIVEVIDIVVLVLVLVFDWNVMLKFLDGIFDVKWVCKGKVDVFVVVNCINC